MFRFPGTLVFLGVAASIVAGFDRPLRGDGLPARITQAWASSGTSYDETDSLAVCAVGSGVRLFATSKGGHFVDVFDASTGKHLHRIGKRGTAEGEFKRPNGIVAIEIAVAGAASRPAILVVERDNARVQAFWADSYESAGVVATGLKRPYGASASTRPDGQFLYVTETKSPPTATVRIYRLSSREGRIAGEHVRDFGEADGPGMIGTAESICVDDGAGRVLICDEREGRMNVKVYTADGKFVGRTFADGMITGEPEGLVVLDTGSNGDGVVVLTDQQKAMTVWHAFDRLTYEHRASFTGEPTIANTDGICVYPRGFAGFPKGAFFAVHDDSEIRAYSLETILSRISSDSRTP